MRARLHARIDELPERQRDVVRLHVIAQLDWAEVAEALGISEANARMSFSHAKKKLAAALQDLPAAPPPAGSRGAP